MPKGIYKRTKKHKQILSKALKGRIAWNKGKKMSKKIKLKMSKSGLKNPARYWLGKHRSDETKKKISKASKGKKKTEKWMQKMKGKTPWNKGKTGHLSNETLEIMKQNNLGKKLSEKTKKKIGLSNIGKHNRKCSKETIKKISGENNHGWKGDNIRIGGVHDWVRKHKGKASNYICEICNESQAQHWSNKKHDYKRNLDDYQALCCSCHNKWDYKYNNKTRRGKIG